MSISHVYIIHFPRKYVNREERNRAQSRTVNAMRVFYVILITNIYVRAVNSINKTVKVTAKQEQL